MNKICIVAVDIRSIHNVGSIFRTADGFSAEVVLTGITPRPIGDKNDTRLPHVAKKAHEYIHKTALGAENKVKWQYFHDIKTAITELHNQNYKIFGIEQSNNSKTLDTFSLEENSAFLLGPEVEGLSEDVLNLCDDIYEIPMSGTKESFNVSVAAGIALYQARFGK
jgi:tRNA G18 (ribose-2'-O)-methylase SpoU